MIAPTENLHNDARNCGVIDQARPIGGWILKPIMETTESPAIEPPAPKQVRGTTTPTPQIDKTKDMTSKAIMRDTQQRERLGVLILKRIQTLMHLTMSNHL